MRLPWKKKNSVSDEKELAKWAIDCWIHFFIYKIYSAEHYIIVLNKYELQERRGEEGSSKESLHYSIGESLYSLVSSLHISH